MKVFKYLLSLFTAFQISIGSNSNFNQNLENLSENSSASVASTPSVTLISNGGIIGWYDQDSLSFLYDSNGMMIYDETVSPKVTYRTNALFTGTTTFTFPSNQKIGICAEPEQNATLAYWIVDGQLKLSNKSGIEMFDGGLRIGMQIPHIILDSNVSTLEAVFVPIPKEASPYVPPLNGKSKIISNGGVIQWISPNPNPLLAYDPTGNQTIDSKGRPIIIRSILGYFSGSQYFSFPSDMNLTFYAEPKLNHTFSYWLVDGIEKLGLVNNFGVDGILPDFPDTSITLQNTFSTLEAVYLPIPEDSAEYIGSKNTPATHYTEGWFYNPSRGWMWTNRDAYPYFYDATDKDWMYFQSGNEKPKFYRYKTKTWLTVE